MEAPPKGMSAAAFNEFMKGEIESRYEQRDGQWVCKTCGGTVQQTTCYVSEHASEFGETHAGDGEVRRIALPYCPSCEGVPQNTSTCVHMPVLSF